MQHFPRSLTYWLSACIFLVCLIIVVGGLTRLTESGLSIVEWKPVSGTLPPLSAQAWEQEFTLYRQSPQYQQINKGMTLHEFQGIFWLEYIHRLLGRITGFVVLLPFLYFLARRTLPKPLNIRMAGILLLFALQGALGWYMVKSGLVHVPMVSPLRLAAHLGLAFIILALLLWTFLDIHKPNFSPAPHIGTLSVLVTGGVFVQVLLGALVAGLDAGLTYNTFPLMDGHLVPDGMWLLEPVWRNLYQNVATVQFNHRLMAGILCLLIPFFWFWGQKYATSTTLKRWLAVLPLLLVLQVGLGIATLLAMVPIWLASLHQAVAVALFMACVRVNHLVFANEQTGKAAIQPA